MAKSLFLRLCEELPPLVYEPKDVNVPSDVPHAENAIRRLVYGHIRLAVLDVASLTDGSGEIASRFIEDGKILLEVIRKQINE